MRYSILTFKILLIGVTAVLGMSALYIPVATPLPGPVLPPPPPIEPHKQYQVWVLNWGFHTSILVERPAHWPLDPLGGEAKYIEYSWGDRSFYRDQDRSVPTLVAAVLLPTPAVVQVRGWTALPDASVGVRDRYGRWVSAATLQRLILALEASMLRTQSGKRLAGQLQPKGPFFPARQFYIAWFTCNTWTVQRLAQAGLARPRPGLLLAEQVPPQLHGFVKKYE